MSTRTAKFKVGLFVLVGVVLGMGAIIWLGAASFFQSASLYVTYFNESVQGLQVDSTVKYRGVDVGRVASIGVAPDYHLIEVVMQIELEGPLHQEVEAQLKSVGITGLVFVGLDRRKPGEEDQSPPLNFISEYPIIPSKPAEIGRMLSGVDEIITRLRAVDFEGLVANFNDSMKSIDGFFKSPRLRAILANLQDASQSLQETAKEVKLALGEGKAGRLVDGTDKLIKEAQTALSEASKALAAVRGETEALRVGSLRDQVGGMVGAVSADIVVAVENLKRASENLERLTQRLQSDPSALLFRRAPGGRD
jgi:phospholipid/cholesterol/gamma-HCH transport system substrate-binding protein